MCSVNIQKYRLIYPVPYFQNVSIYFMDESTFIVSNYKTMIEKFFALILFDNVTQNLYRISQLCIYNIYNYICKIVQPQCGPFELVFLGIMLSHVDKSYC